MKRFIVLFLVFVFIPCLSVHGQVIGKIDGKKMTIFYNDELRLIDICMNGL
jgi:hypothetical protein